MNCENSERNCLDNSFVLEESTSTSLSNSFWWEIFWNSMDVENREEMSWQGKISQSNGSGNGTGPRGENEYMLWERVNVLTNVKFKVKARGIQIIITADQPNNCEVVAVHCLTN